MTCCFSFQTVEVSIFFNFSNIWLLMNQKIIKQDYWFSPKTKHMQAKLCKEISIRTDVYVNIKWKKIKTHNQVFGLKAAVNRTNLNKNVKNSKTQEATSNINGEHRGGIQI